MLNGLDTFAIVRPFIRKGQRILLLGMSTPDIEKEARRRNAYLKTIGRFFYQKRFDSQRFFGLAKKERESFDVVLDLGFSSYLYKNELAGFYTYAARVLKFRGKLVSLVLSPESEDCKKRCPVRHWSYYDRHYVRFLPKNELKGFVEAKFRIEYMNKRKFDGNVYHEFVGVNDMRKF